MNNLALNRNRIELIDEITDKLVNYIEELTIVDELLDDLVHLVNNLLVQNHSDNYINVYTSIFPKGRSIKEYRILSINSIRLKVETYKDDLVYIEDYLIDEIYKRLTTNK